MTKSRTGFGVIASALARWRVIVLYRLLGPWRERRRSIERVGGQTFVVEPGVFNPVLHLSGAAIADMIDASIIAPGARVLDLGTGCGVLAVRVSAYAREVVAADISAVAVQCTQANVDRLGLSDQISVVESDLFLATGIEPFDVIIANPPYEIDAPVDDVDTSFASSDFFDRLAGELAAQLVPGGVMFMALPDGVVEPIAILERAGNHCETWRTARTPVGSVTLWRIRPPS